MKLHYAFLLLLSTLSLQGIAQQNSAPKTLGTTPFTIGETRTFYSDILKENRTIRIPTRFLY